MQQITKKFKVIQLNIGPDKPGSNSRTIKIGEVKDASPETNLFTIGIDHDSGVLTLSLKDNVDSSNIGIRTNFELSVDSDKIEVAANIIMIVGVKGSSTIACLNILNNQETKNLELIFSDIGITELTAEEGCIINSLSFDNSEIVNAPVGKSSNLTIPPNITIYNLSMKGNNCLETLRIGNNCTIGVLEVADCISLQKMIFLEKTKISDIKIAATKITAVMFQSGCELGSAKLSDSAINKEAILLFETGCKIYHSDYGSFVTMYYATSNNTLPDVVVAIQEKFGAEARFDVFNPGSVISTASKTKTWGSWAWFK
jgi:hypothetical protein